LAYSGTSSANLLGLVHCQRLRPSATGCKHRHRVSVDVVACLVVYSPTPRVMWTRLARPLNERSSMPADQFGQELIIRDVRLEDAGHYQCSASNSVDNPVTHVITLTVECQSNCICRCLRFLICRFIF